MSQLCLVKFARKSTLNKAFHKGYTMLTLTTKKAIKRAQSRSKRHRNPSLKRIWKRAYKTKGQRGFDKQAWWFCGWKNTAKNQQKSVFREWIWWDCDKKEFLEHFKGKPDEESRLAHLHLIEPTKASPNAVLKCLIKTTINYEKPF